MSGYTMTYEEWLRYSAVYAVVDKINQKAERQRQWELVHYYIDHHRHKRVRKPCLSLARTTGHHPARLHYRRRFPFPLYFR